MGQFVGIAVREGEKGEQKLTAIFKGCVIHIGVDDQQVLMKASSRFQRAHLNDSAAVPKAECFRALNAWLRVERDLKEGKISVSDLPKERDFEGLWQYGPRP